MSPSLRNMGGLLLEKWRSEHFFWIISRKNFSISGASWRRVYAGACGVGAGAWGVGAGAARGEGAGAWAAGCSGLAFLSAMGSMRRVGEVGDLFWRWRVMETAVEDVP